MLAPDTTFLKPCLLFLLVSYMRDDVSTLQLWMAQDDADDLEMEEEESTCTHILTHAPPMHAFACAG